MQCRKSNVLELKHCGGLTSSVMISSAHAFFTLNTYVIRMDVFLITNLFLLCLRNNNLKATINAHWQDSQSSTSTSIWGLPWLGTRPSAQTSVCGPQTYKHRVWGHFQCASGCSGFWFTVRHRVFRATQRDVTTATVSVGAVSVEFEQSVNNLAALRSLRSARLQTATHCLCNSAQYLQHFNSRWLQKSAHINFKSEK